MMLNSKLADYIFSNLDINKLNDNDFASLFRIVYRVNRKYTILLYNARPHLCVINAFYKWHYPECMRNDFTGVNIHREAIKMRVMYTTHNKKMPGMHRNILHRLCNFTTIIVANAQNIRKLRNECLVYFDYVVYGRYIIDIGALRNYAGYIGEFIYLCDRV